MVSDYILIYSMDFISFRREFENGIFQRDRKNFNINFIAVSNICSYSQNYLRLSFL